MNISFRISVLLIMLFAIIAPRCHALSDFAGQGKAPLTWAELMQPRVDPSRYFATPGGGHGDHPAGGYSAPQAVTKAKPDKPAAPEVKPDESKDPNPPHIPMVRPPKPKPEVKPEQHKCWSFKFRCTPKAPPKCKHETVKPDKKPSRRKGVVGHKKSECSKPDHKGPTTSNPGKDSSCGKFGGLRGGMGPGMKGHGLGHRSGHHGKGKGRR